MVPQVGQRIGPYEILGRLGSGGMGLVFSAWDARLQRDVAIKLLREEYATPDMRQRFLQEARAASGLNHANICTIFDIGEQDGDPFLVMELLKGETLRHRMNEGNIQVREVLRVAHDVADALSVAHGRGIIHRDIKPANVMLVDKPGGGYTSKVLDFGLAKIDSYGTESIFDLTHTGTTVGTVSYMSPEQARGEPLDARSDLFSLGVVLYEMATGRLPFQGATSALVFVELLSNHPAPIRPQNPLIPEDLELLILKLLEKDRTLRYQSGQQLVEAVAEIPFAVSGAGNRQAWSTGAPLIPVLPPIPQPRRVISQPSSRAMMAAAREARESSASADKTALPTRSRLNIPRPAGTPPPPASRTDISAANLRAAQPGVSHPVDADEVIRPVRRVVTGDSSSAYIRAQSSAVQPVAPVPSPGSSAVQPAAVPPPPEPTPVPPPSSSRVQAVQPTPVPVPKPRDASSGSHPIATRPIVPQSARTAQPDVPHILLPRPQPRPAPTPRFHRYEEVDNANQPPKPVSTPAPIAVAPPLPPLRVPGESYREPSGRKWLVPVILVGAAAVAFAGWHLWPSKAVPAGDRVVPIAMGPVTNSTGNTTLTGAFTAGLSLALAQSPQFQVNDISALNAGLHSVRLGPADTVSPDNLRVGAKAMGVTEILSGSISTNAGAYTLGVHVRSVATGDDLFHAEETAQSTEQITDALDRLVVDLRNGLSEPTDEIQRTSIPLSKEASGSIDALNLYASGLEFLNHGALEDAAAAMEKATTADKNFAQAYLRLADIYWLQHAPAAAATASVSARTAAANSSERTQQLAEASYDLNATGDSPAVAAVTSKLLEDYPNAVQARIFAAMALQEQGKLQEALDTVQGALRRSPFDSIGLRVEETILLALDHPSTAREDFANRAGHPHPDLRLLINFVSAGQQGPIDLSADATGNVALGETQASLLDAVGQSHEGLRRFQTVAIDASKNPNLNSAAADSLSMASLNRALTNDCTNANSLSTEARNYGPGPLALFRVGISSALCGDPSAARSIADELSRGSWQNSYLVKNVYAPQLNAVAAWKDGDTARGLNILQNSKTANATPLAAYFRGQMHLQTHEYSAAIGDLSPLTQHAGSAVLVNPMLPALAQFGIAHAWQASGDTTNGPLNYTKFLNLWPNADPGSPLVAEARSHAN
jgi:serine/threonine protein kinase/tetratricopeptide (TPR) repeat protein